MNSPAFSAPPTLAVLPGDIAPVPEVSVSEPPGVMRSWPETILPHSAAPQNLTPKRCAASGRSVVAMGPRMMRSTLVKMRWSIGAREVRSDVKLASSRTSATWPVRLGFDADLMAASSLGCEEEIIVTRAP